MLLNRAYIKIENRYDSSLRELLSENFSDVELEIENDENIYQVTAIDNESFQMRLTKLLEMYLSSFNSKIAILIVPYYSKMFYKYIDKCSNQANSLFEIFARDIDSNQVRMDAKKIVESLNKSDIEMLESFLKCNGNSCKCAEELYLHRNSLNYRINCFAERTSIDIRDLNSLMFLNLILNIN